VHSSYSSAEKFHSISQITEDAFSSKTKSIIGSSSPQHRDFGSGSFIAGAASRQEGFPRACILHFAACLTTCNHPHVGIPAFSHPVWQMRAECDLIILNSCRSCAVILAWRSCLRVGWMA
jgi:hypothetical protein